MKTKELKTFLTKQLDSIKPIVEKEVMTKSGVRSIKGYTKEQVLLIFDCLDSKYGDSVN